MYAARSVCIPVGLQSQGLPKADRNGGAPG